MLGPIKNESNKVLTFYQQKNLEPKCVGWNQASTFNGFCSKHDKSIFSIIEDEEILPTEEQVFVLGYRGYCHELYQKNSALRASQFLTENLLKGKSIEEQFHYGQRIAASNAGVKKAVLEFSEIKNEILDKSFTQKDYDRFSSYFIEFSGEQVIAACGAISPDFDVFNSPLQHLHDLHSNGEHMSVNLINENKKILFTLLWPREYSKCTKFVSSLNQLKESEIVRVVFAILFGYLENVYFSESWWVGLRESERLAIANLSQNVFYSRYLPELNFYPIKWEIEKVIKKGF